MDLKACRSVRRIPSTCANPDVPMCLHPIDTVVGHEQASVWVAMFGSFGGHDNP